MKSELNRLASIDAELAEKLENDEAFRRRYIRAFSQAEVAAQIQALRRKRGLRQQDLARLANTGQSAISRIEKADYEGWSYKTLIRIAEELKARLRIILEPIEDVANGYRATTTVERVIVLGIGTDEEDVVV